MNVVSATEMGRVEQTCGIPTSVLMESAGEGIVEVLESFVELESANIVIFAGIGNNGGDGFTAAHKLAGRCSSLTVYTPSSREQIIGDSLENYDKAVAKNVTFLSETAWASALEEADLVVDALFGTGLSRDLEEPYAGIVNAINNQRTANPETIVISVDVPSGICADSGQIYGCAVDANATVTFGRPKRGMFLYPAAQFTGEIFVDQIGISDVAFITLPGEILENYQVAELLPRRSPLEHKGGSKVMVVGGCAGMSGAAYLAANGAFSAGAGYVFLGMPDNVGDYGGPIEAVRTRLASRPGGYFGPTVHNEVINMSDRYDAFVIGGGFGRANEERTLAARLSRLISKPAVIDADIFHLVSVKDFHYADGPRVLTPHIGEYTTVFGGSVEAHEANRIEAALAGAKSSGQVLVLKGRPTITATPDGQYVINPTGDEHLATCGSGDVLAGVIGGLLARGLDTYSAGFCGAFLHGKTVEFWDYPVGFTATKIAERIPAAWKSVLEEAPED